jgi:DNA-binding transcriptional LysR family regulator
MIERYLLRYFLAVVDQGNFSRAAVHCNVSQPTLSAGIAKLENALQRQLFSRTNQRVQLTEAGTRFLTHARRIEREFNVALGAMADTAQQRPVRVGVLSSIAGALVARAARAYRAGGGGPVEIAFASERELTAMLARDRLDAAFTILRPSAQPLAQQVVGEEGYAMVMATDHPLAGRALVSAEDLRDETMIVRRHCELLSQTSRHFLERGVRPHFSLRTTNDERALQMVGAGMGVTVMPDCYRSADVAHVPMVGFDHRRTLGFVLADEGVAAHGLLRALAAAFGEGNVERD